MQVRISEFPNVFNVRHFSMHHLRLPINPVTKTLNEKYIEFTPNSESSNYAEITDFAQSRNTVVTFSGSD